MRPLSPRAQELVSTLQRQSTLAERFLGRAAQDVAVLTELAGHSEPALVSHLLDFVFSDVPAVARAAAVTLERALAAASPDELLELDRACRQWWPYGLAANSRWSSLKPIEVSRFSAFGESGVAVVGVASFHGDGYVREAAMTRLAATGSGRELPFLLVRLNDWVERIAEHALAAVEQRVIPTYASSFVDNLPILLRLEISQRREHRHVLDRIYALLRDPAQGEVIARGLTATDRRIRRTAFRLAREAPGADRRHLLHQALRDSDTVIRLEAVVDARQRLPIDDLVSVLPAIAPDPYPPIRREAIRAAAERLASDGDAWLISGLHDSNKSVRETARYFLRRSGGVSDFASHYRERIQRAESPRQLASALAGLGETGAAGDASWVLPYLEHERPAVRRASVRALAALDLAGQLPRIVQMLHDPAPGVSHTVRKVLRPRAGRIGLNVLTTVFRTTPHVHSRFDAIALGAALGKWESLPLLLEAAADGHEALRTSARLWLNGWIANQNRSFVRPTAAQIQTIHTALDAYRFVVEPAVASELRSILSLWES